MQPLETVFSGLLLDALQRSKSTEQTSYEADFVVAALRLNPGASVLDVPCGDGRISIELARRGYQVAGIDFTKSMLEAAQRKAEAQGVQVDWQHGDMRELPWEDHFDGAFCFWESFGYFDDEGNLAFLKSARRALKRGGRLILDTHCAESLFPKLQIRDWGEMGDMIALEERTFDHEQGRVNRIWTIISGGKVEKKILSMRIYTYRELCGLLAQAGFGNIEGYSFLSSAPFRFGYSRLNMVAMAV